MRLAAGLVSVLIAVGSGACTTVVESDNKQLPVTTVSEPPTSTSISNSTISTTEESLSMEEVICKINESLHNDIVYKGLFSNCTNSHHCVMNEDWQLEALKTVLKCLDRDGNAHLCMFEWYVHWRNCVGSDCYGVALDCEYEKSRGVGGNNASNHSPIVNSEQRSLAKVLLFVIGIGVGVVLILSAIVACYFYYSHHHGWISIRKRERNFATRRATGRSPSHLSTFTTISISDSPLSM